MTKEKYYRKPLEVEVVKYEVGLGLEDGFEPWHNVVTNAWINTDFLVKVTQNDGRIVCPYIMNKRGRIFIGTDDYIIYEKDHERHVCGGDKFNDRFARIEE